MVRFSIVKHQDKKKTGLVIRGHANYVKRGADIVCAAVSAIGQTAYIGVKAFADTTLKHLQEGYISFVCDKTTETDAIIFAAISGLKQLEKQYPQCVGEINIYK